MSQILPDRKQVLHWLGILLVVAIVVPFVMFAIPGVVGGAESYVVLSGSMEPTISVGDVVVVDETEPSAVEEGDVITYVRSDAEKPTTHRVIEVIEQDGTLAFQTQGDANDEPDAEPVHESELQGTVILTLPYIGYVVSFANTPMGFVTLVVLPFTLLVATELRSLLTQGRCTDNTDQAASSAVDDGSDDEHGSAENGSSETAPAVDPSSTVSAPPTQAIEDPTDMNAPTESQSQTDDGGQNPPASTPEQDESSVDDGDASTSDTADDEKTIAITQTDLRLSFVLVFGFTVYAGWVVLTIQEAISFAVAFASGIGLVLVAAMYYLAGSTATDDETGGDSERGTEDLNSGNHQAAETNFRSPTNGAPDDDNHAGIAANGAGGRRGRERSRITVDSVETMLTLIAAESQDVVREEHTGRYRLLSDEVAYEWGPDDSAVEMGTEGIADTPARTVSGQVDQSVEDSGPIPTERCDDGSRSPTHAEIEDDE